MLLRLAKSYPFRFGMAYSLFKTSGCDLMVQKVVEKRETIDWRRNAAFGTFGLLYLGGVQYMLYVPLFSRLFPNAASFAGKSIGEKLRDPKGIRDLFAQVFLDQGVHHPLMYFPVFYMIKDFVTSDSPSPVRAVTEYTTNYKEDLVALWKIWIPSTFINFAFMPMWGRIPWVASTSLIWTCILSAMRGGNEVEVPNTVFGHVDAKSLERIMGALAAPPPVLRPGHEHLLITLAGADRPGIIREVTKTLYSHEASITSSKMMSLGPEFGIMMHVECEPSKATIVRSALSEATKGLEVTMRSVASAQPLSNESTVEAPFAGQISLTGVDRPGLLYKLSDVLVAHGLNIGHLQTTQHSTRKDAAARLFTTHCHVSGKVPDVAALRKALKQLEGELDCLCALEVSTH